MVTEVEPPGRPATGRTVVTVGTGAKLNLSAPEVALVAAGVVTVTSNVPACPAAMWR